MNRKRTKTMLVKKVTIAKILSGMPKMFGIVSNPLDKQIESQFMAKEEKDQRKTDNFWGQDKDLHDRELERTMMVVEDEASLKNEHWNEKVKLHNRWDEEYQRNQWYENRSQFMFKEIERREYLKFVHSSLSSNEVINFVWDRNAEVDVDKGSTVMQNMSAIGNEISLSLPSTIGALHMSIHLDGLQQSKAIVEKASNSFKKTLRRVNNQTASDNASNSLTIKKKSHFNASENLTNVEDREELLVIPSRDETNRVMPSFYNQYIPTVDGHSIHKWDQDLMLQLAFIGLDEGNKGYLTLEEVAKVSNNAVAHSLLKFTVFWVHIKKRNWLFFENMSYNRMKTSVKTVKKTHKNTHTNVSSGSPGISVGESPGDCGGGLTMIDWLSAASSIAYEFSVPLRHIRLQSEHIGLCTSSHQQVGRKGLGCDPANLFSMLPEREHRCARILHEGDCVWALHLSGALWLPAVIKKVHMTVNNDVNSHYHNYHHNSNNSKVTVLPHSHTTAIAYCGYTYDLIYPLSERDLQKSRMMTTSRQLLSLPSQQTAGVQDGGGDSSLLPRPIEHEKGVCSFAFDLVDSAGVGMVPLLRLVECLQSSEFGRIVMTSLALSTIFTEGSFCINADRNGTTVGTAQDIPSLLPVFIDTFSSLSSNNNNNILNSSSRVQELASGNSSDDWISKLDFLEFCIAVIDIKRYSIVT